MCIISILLNLWRLVLWSTCDLSWRMPHVHLKRMCILFLDEMFCMYLLSSSSLMCQRHCFLIDFYMDNLSIDVGGVLKSSTIFVLLCIYCIVYYYYFIVHFSISVNICFMYLGIPMLDAWILTIVLSSRINPFIIMYCPFCHLLRSPC